MTTRTVTALAAVMLAAAVAAPAAKADEPRFAHMLFFTLKDHSTEARDKFVASCNKYLANHEGTVFFAVGTVADEVEPNVGVRDFDVALHLVFENKAAEGKY